MRASLLELEVEKARRGLLAAADSGSCFTAAAAALLLPPLPADKRCSLFPRCSRCRIAEYCGTTCSHADWKAGGHKKMCPLLAAAQFAAQE